MLALWLFLILSSSVFRDQSGLKTNLLRRFLYSASVAFNFEVN